MALKVLRLPQGIASLQKCYLPVKFFEDFGASFSKYVAIKFKAGYCIVKLNFISNLDHSSCYVNAAVSSFSRSSQSIFCEGLVTSNIIPQEGPFEAKIVNISVIFRNLDKLVEWKKKNSVNTLVEILKFYVVGCGTNVFVNDLEVYLDIGIAYLTVNNVRGRKSVIGAVYKVVSSTDIIVDSELTEIMVQSKNSVDCGGMEKYFESLVDIVNCRKLVKQSYINRNVLLVGPAGCGKKMLIMKVAKHCNALVVEVEGSKILCPRDSSGKPGEVEANIRHTFDVIKVFCELLSSCDPGRTPSKNGGFKSTKGRFCSSPIVVLLLAHIELMCPNRTQRAGSQTTQLLGAIDSLQNLSNLVIFATTTAVDQIDNAIRRPGRLDKEVYIGIPSEVERSEMMKNLLLKDEMWSSCIGDVMHLARAAATLTPGRVPAELSLLCHQVKWMQIQRSHSGAGKEEESSSSRWLDDFTLCAAQLPVSSLIGGPGTLISSDTLGGGPGLSSIGGLQRIKDRLIVSVREPLLHPEAFRRLGIRPPRGVLLYGPPGCAKTTLARALASPPASSSSTSGHTITFLSCSAAELYSPFVGDSEKTVVELFERARAGAPSIVFIDELDALFGSRDGMHKGGVQERVLAALLMEIDGVGHRLIASTAASVSSHLSADQMMMDSVGGERNLSPGELTHFTAARQHWTEPFSLVTVIAATNRPDLIDDALLRPGRLDQLVYIPPPDEDARLAILSYYTERMPIDGGDKETLLRELAQGTCLYSGADLKNLCKEAALKAISEEGFGVEAVKKEHFAAALKAMRSSLTSDTVLSYQKFHDNKL